MFRSVSRCHIEHRNLSFQTVRQVVNSPFFGSSILPMCECQVPMSWPMSQKRCLVLVHRYFSEPVNIGQAWLWSVWFTTVGLNFPVPTSFQTAFLHVSPQAHPSLWHGRRGTCSQQPSSSCVAGVATYGTGLALVALTELVQGRLTFHASGFCYAAGAWISETFVVVDGRSLNLCKSEPEPFRAIRPRVAVQGWT